MSETAALQKQKSAQGKPVPTGPDAASSLSQPRKFQQGSASAQPGQQTPSTPPTAPISAPSGPNPSSGMSGRKPSPDTSPRMPNPNTFSAKTPGSSHKSEKGMPHGRSPARLRGGKATSDGDEPSTTQLPIRERERSGDAQRAARIRAARADALGVTGGTSPRNPAPRPKSQRLIELQREVGRATREAEETRKNLNILKQKMRDATSQLADMGCKQTEIEKECGVVSERVLELQTVASLGAEFRALTKLHKEWSKATSRVTEQCQQVMNEMSSNGQSGPVSPRDKRVMEMMKNILKDLDEMGKFSVVRCM